MFNSSLRNNLVITKTTLHEPNRDVLYWRSRPPLERLAALEEIRNEFHQWKYHVQPGFQRVYTVTQR
jgi:hypothetical protein